MAEHQLQYDAHFPDKTVNDLDPGVSTGITDNDNLDNGLDNDDSHSNDPDNDRGDLDDYVSHAQVAPDGGWGWVIVVAVFFGNVLIDGCAGSFGILLPELLDEFQASESLTSMAGSIIVAIYLFSSPLVGSLVKQFGCRPVCFAGGCVVAAGFILSIFATNIWVFMGTFGVIGGLGLGLNSLSGHVMVNSYFDRRRGIAGGIVSSGAGFGVFVCAPLLQYLIYEYAWKGAVLIFSGIMLQFCVAAALLRPVEETNGSRYVDNIETDDCSLDKYESMCRVHHTTPLLIRSSDVRYEVINVNEIKPSVTHNEEPGAHCAPDLHNSKWIGRGTQGHFLSTFNVNQDINYSGKALNSLPDLSSVGRGRAGNSQFPHKKPLKHTRTDCKSTDECHHQRQLPNCQDHHHHHHHSHHTKHFHPLLRKDIFYSGSLHRLPEFQKADNMESFVQSVTIHPGSESETRSVDDETTAMHGKTVFSHLNKCWPKHNDLCDVSIFKNSVYIPMLIGGVLIQMGQFIPNTFIPEYCRSTLQLDDGEISTIISVFGALNIFGRLSAGALANVAWVSPLWLCNGAMLMCAVCCVLFPLCTTFTTLCIYAIGFGFFIGYFPPLQVLIMVKYLGLDRLTSSVGFLQMAKGPAALVGPPLAGMVFEWTRDYAMSLEFAAFLFFMAAIVQSLVPVIDRCAGNQQRDATFTLEVEVDTKDCY